MRSSGGGMLISLLMTLMILGGLGALVISDTGSPLSVPTTISVPTTGHTTQSTQSPVSAAEQISCIQDADQLVTALSDFQLVSGTTLGVEVGIHIGDPATYPSGRDAEALLGSTYLPTWPQGTGFALSISTTRAGDIAVYVPATSHHPMLFEGESASTGCNAL